MKKIIIAAGVVLITAVSFGQKKELKKAEKAIKSGNFTEAMAQIDAAESLLGAADDMQKSKFYAVKAMALSKAANTNFDKMKMAAEAYAKAAELAGNISPELEAGITQLRTDLINEAVKDQKANNHASASEKLFISYNITKRDTSDLYFAAGSAVNAKDMDNAIKYYKMLLDLGYNGSSTSYVATEKETGQVTPFGSKSLRDLSVKSGQYIKPDIQKEPSKKGEILRNMTLIYIEQGKSDEAKAILAKARKENPTDVSLIQAEANMAYQLEDFANYNRLMEEVVKSDPTNPELYFNLGVGATGNGDIQKAFSYYEKAIELKPDYRDAIMNYAILKLDAEKVIVEEMNGLGSSNADNARYDILKEKRVNIYKEAAPYLEKALALDDSGTNNTNVMKTLLSIYSQLGEDAKYKALKAKLDGM